MNQHDTPRSESFTGVDAATSADSPAAPVTDRRALLAGIGGLAAGAFLAGARTAKAGPLNPPTGPITSTGKPLTEVEPRIAVNAANTPGDTDSLFKITQPGSYYLTGNIEGVLGKHGIEIAASGVTLDLNGFDVLGPGPGGPFDGVSATVSNLTNISVLNGTVRDWGRDGINLGDAGVTGCRIEGVHVSGNVRIGIYAGIYAVISRCTGRGGQYGVYGREGSTITACTATAASVVGIGADPGTVIVDSTAYLNTGSGIGTNAVCSIINCTAADNDLSGISVSDGCYVSTCSASRNSQHGIAVGSRTTVADCIAFENELDGIRCSFECVIRGNASMRAGVFADGAAIHALGGGNVIEGNTCRRSRRGIDVDAPSNFIVRNTCSVNTTNWDVVSGNVILVVNAATAGVVNGSAGGTAPGSTDPNANFTY